MSNQSHKKIIAALYLALKPLARMFLKVGMGYSEFSNVAKSAFIKVSSEEYGVRGRQTNTSRIAAMNGLSRKEVGRLRKIEAESLYEIAHKDAPLYVLLHMWESHSKYLDENGKPRVLPFTGNKISFSGLVERYIGDLPPGAVRTELKRIGAITELPDKTLKLEDAVFFPSAASERIVVGLGSLYALADTVEYNGSVSGGDATRLQRLALVDDFPSDKLEASKVYVEEKLKHLSEELDAYLTEQKESAPESSSKIRVGFGLYYYEMPDVEEYW